MDSTIDEHLDGDIAGNGTEIRLQVPSGSSAQLVQREQDDFTLTNAIQIGQLSAAGAAGTLITQATQNAGPAPGYNGLGGWRPGQKITLNMADGTPIEDLYVKAIHIPVDGFFHLQVEYRGAEANYPSSPVNAGAVAQIALDTSAISYELSDLALVCNKVSPPEGYVKALMKQVEGSSGLTMDFKTYSLVRNTLPAQTGMLSQNIPCTHSEAYSILSIPYNAAQYGTYGDAFNPDHTGSETYQYFIDGEAVPNRSVPLGRLAQIPAMPEPLHLREMTKALENCGIPVRNLTACQYRSLIGRALSQQGQVADLSGADVRLQVEYAGGQAVTTKQFDHHVCLCAQLTIQDNGISVRR